jgi:hypothetical protein
MQELFFGKLNSPSFIFRGKHGDRAASLQELFFDYPLDEIREKPDFFFDSVKSVYQQEKFQNPINSGKMMDLGNGFDLMRMRHHLKVHAITGLPELGTSTTESIPYWDRQGFVFGLKHLFSDNWEYYQQMVDLESVNVLRAILAIYIPRYKYAAMCVQNLNELKQKKERFTRSDINSSIQGQYNAWKEISGNYQRFLLGKIKHLFFCLDKISDRDIRVFGLNEIEALLESSAIDRNELSINLGVDGGVTESTYRPKYQIHMHVQLRHLERDIVSIPDAINVEWSYLEWKNSLSRLASQDSFLKEPSEFILDWKF